MSTPSTSMRIPSIGQLKENIGKPAEEAATNKNPTTQTNEESSASQQVFTLEQLTRVWNAFAENLKSKGKINEHMVLTSTVLDLQPDFSIHITIGNEVQMDQLEGIKIELLSHLRHSLKNNALRLQTKIGTVATKEKKFFTDDDKLKFLTEHYPVVAELRKKLGLEINY
jgi:DNA polymerase-3 subunit gamma/tau